MSYGLSLGLENLQYEIEESSQILESLRVDDSLPIGLIAEFRVAILRDLDEAHHLVVAQADDRVVHAALVQSEPIVVWFAIRPHTEPIPIDADSGPLSQPCSCLS